MFGILSGYSDTDSIFYCPACGERVSDRYTDGTCRCEVCGLRFGVIEIDEEDQELGEMT